MPAPALQLALVARRSFLFVAAVVLIGGAPAAAQTPGSSHAHGASAPHDRDITIASWTTTQGLPSNAVLDMRQARDGYLWLASYQGLVRFDGATFRAFTEADIPGLSRSSFWALAEDSTGVLWAAAEDGGLVRYARGHFSMVDLGDGLANERLTALAADGGGLWLGGRSGVGRYASGSASRLPIPPSGEEPYVSALVPDRAGGVWIGTVSDGLLHFNDGRYTHFGAAQGLHDRRISTLYLDPAGTLWIGTYGGTIATVRHGRLSLLPTESGGPQRVNTMLEEEPGLLWIGAENGLFLREGDKLTPVPQADGHPFSRVEVLTRDAEGSLWVGTRQNGIHRIRAASFINLTMADGLPHDLVYAVTGDRTSGTWVATNGGLLRWSEGRSTLHSVATGSLRDDIVRDVLRAGDGVIWAATNGGLTRIEGGRTRTYTTRDGLVDDRVRALAEDGRGGLWVGTMNGLSHLRDGRFRTFGRARGLSDGYVLSLFVTRAGTLYVGTQSEGLLRLDDDRFTVVSPELARQPVFRIHEDAAGTLWIGSTRGLVRIEGNRVTRYTARDGLPGNTVFGVIDDAFGYLWLTGPWGVARTSAASLQEVTAGTRPLAQVKHFGLHDGMPVDEVTSISRLWRAPDGTIWFPTPAGVTRVDPAVLKANRRPPPVLIEQLLADDLAVQDTAGAGIATVPSGARKLELHYSAPGFVAPQHIRFRYRLDGFDTDWVQGGSRRVAFYTNLPPGSYRFRVQARNEDGVWNNEGASLAFKLRPHLWQTGWFAALEVLALIVAVLVLHRIRLRRERSAVQEAERESTRRRVSAILESISDGFVALDDEWRFTYVNGTAERMLERPRNQLLGQVCWDVLPHTLRETVEPELRRVAAGRTPAVVESPGGTAARRWLELHAYPAESGISVYVADVTVRKEAEAALRSLSLRDELTGLYNRRGLLALAEQQVRTAERTARGFHVVFLDMDGLKAINDSLGHPQGDQALVDLAILMRRTFRESDVLARLGGDEFAALLLDDGSREIEHVCTRLRSAMRRLNETSGRPYQLHASIGYSRFDPTRPASVEALLELADQRMYADKYAKRLEASSRA